MEGYREYFSDGFLTMFLDTRGHTVRFNRGTFEALGCPRKIRMFMDPERKLFLLENADNTDSFGIEYTLTDNRLCFNSPTLAADIARYCDDTGNVEKRGECLTGEASNGRKCVKFCLGSEQN